MLSISSSAISAQSVLPVSASLARRPLTWTSRLEPRAPPLLKPRASIRIPAGLVVLLVTNSPDSRRSSSGTVRTPLRSISSRSITVTLPGTSRTSRSARVAVTVTGPT